MKFSWRIPFRFDPLAVLVGAVSFVLLLLFQAQGVAGGDSGDLAAAAASMGVAHPPGYPLYTLIGWVLSRLPVFTPAWRIGLLSSIPHALVAGVTCWLVYTLTRRRWAGLFAAAVILGNYLFFLYGTTVEVFALLDLFVLTLVAALLVWKRTHDNRWLVAAAGVFGLSLTHHHLIVFLLPAVSYLLWQSDIWKKNRWKPVVPPAVFWFLAGLLPYAYVVVAGHGPSLINWDRPVGISGFVRLVTRADYGTFLSSGYYGSLLVQRLLGLKAMLEYIWLDFGEVGVTLIAAGMLGVWRRDKVIAIFLLFAVLFIGPLFFLYASFPLASRFTLATYERFLLPTYVFLTVYIGCGAAYVTQVAMHALQKKGAVPAGSRILILLILLLFLFPVSRLRTTVWRFWGMPFDRTADHVGIDVLSSLPPGSIVFLSRDTTLFSTQYVRYALRVRPDVIALHASRLESPDYQKTVRGAFPAITFTPGAKNVIADLIGSQYKKRRIFSTTPLGAGAGWHWVPYGLTYEVVSQSDLPDVSTVYAQNLAIWRSLHDPTRGILSRYNHLMLSDVRDVYAGGRLALGKTLLHAGMVDEASGQFEAAIALDGDVQLADAYTYHGLTKLFFGQCDEALVSFDRASRVSFTPQAHLLFYKSITYRDCAGDEEAAKRLLDEYERLQKSAETPLR